MDDESRILINSFAQDIINLYNIQVPIQNINEVVSVLGGRIEENTSIDGNGNIRRENDGFVICISPLQNPQSKRFIMAYELGHLFLHMGYQINKALWNKQKNLACYKSNDISLEYQANEFAMAFLMPQKEYKEMVDQHVVDNKVKINELADYFDVPTLVAFNRGKDLGYLHG